MLLEGLEGLKDRNHDSIVILANVGERRRCDG